MHELKLLELTATKKIALGDYSLRSQACNEALISFERNISMAIRLIEAPLFAAFMAERHTSAQDSLFIEVFGTMSPTEKQLTSETKNIGFLMGERMAKMVNVDAHTQKHLMLANGKNLSNFIRNVGGDMPVIFDNLLKSVAIQAWTAFEVMAGDLWENVINEHPHILAGLSAKGDSEKKIDLWMLQKHDFNLSRIMGTILRSKFNFQVLAEVRKAYLSAFSKDGTDVAQVVSECDLDALSLIRNLLVHKGGIIDQIFITESSSVPGLSTIRDLGIRSPIPFDGQMVRSLIEPVMNVSCHLIQSVDNWLIKHPSP